MSFLKKKIFNKTTVAQNLTTIYGIGSVSAHNICQIFGCNPELTFSNLRDDQLYKLLTYIEKNYLLIENSLKLRSEELTSELQSLMRLSCAVLCLKKKSYYMQLIII